MSDAATPHPVPRPPDHPGGDRRVRELRRDRGRPPDLRRRQARRSAERGAPEAQGRNRGGPGGLLKKSGLADNADAVIAKAVAQIGARKLETSKVVVPGSPTAVKQSAPAAAPRSGDTGRRTPTPAAPAAPAPAPPPAPAAPAPPATPPAPADTRHRPRRPHRRAGMPCAGEPALPVPSVPGVRLQLSSAFQDYMETNPTALSSDDSLRRAAIDRSVKWPVLFLFANAAQWLLASTVMGLIVFHQAVSRRSFSTANGSGGSTTAVSSPRT